MGTRPRTKALKADQLKGDLKGDLAAYEKFGLFQRSVNQNTAYRYRGALLRYQLFLGENPPSLAATGEYLGLLRKNAFDPSTLRVYRAALAGYHQWRGEELKFKVKVPETSAKYVPWGTIQRMLELASAKPHDQLILRLMTDAGLRRDEVVKLKLSNVEGSKLRFRGKGGKERTIEPYSIEPAATGHASYVVAYCHYAGEIRHLRKRARPAPYEPVPSTPKASISPRLLAQCS